MLEIKTFTQSEITLLGDAGRFSLEIRKPNISSADPILLLPNGYGMLAYAQTVAEELANLGHTVYALNTRGQGQSDGEYSVRGAAEDILIAMDAITAFEKSLHLLVHCSAALPLIHLGANSYLWRMVNSVLLYCYLAEPQSHLDRFRTKCNRYGVRLAADVGRLDCYGPESYRSIPVPFSIIHPQLPANLRRASLRQAKDLAERTGAKHLSTPMTGYNINSRSQKPAVRETVTRHFASLLAA